MTEKELLEKLAQFQQIKPNNDWANWCLNNILSQKPASNIKSEAKQSWKPKITLAAFDIIRKYRVALATSALMVIFVSTFALAQTSLPNSPLYTLKTLTQDIRLALTPQEQKPLVKMQIAEARLNDLAQVKDLNNKKEIIAQQIKKDLETVPQDLKKLPVRKDTLAISQKVQEKSSDLSKTLQNLNLENNTKDSLSKTLTETQNEVLAVITETSEKINSCPTYLNEELNTLQKTILENPQLFERWSATDLAKIKSDLIDATNDLKADNCLEAMAKIESINQLMQIHSLEDTTTSTTK